MPAVRPAVYLLLLLTTSALPAMEWKTEAWYPRVKAAEVAFGQGRYAEYVAQIGPAYGWLDAFRTVGILCRLAYCHGLDEARPAVEELAGLLTVHCPPDAERLGQLSAALAGGVPGLVALAGGLHPASAAWGVGVPDAGGVRGGVVAGRFRYAPPARNQG